MCPRPDEQGPSTAVRDDASQPADRAAALLDARATANAMRAEAGVAERGAGPTRGEPVDPRARLDGAREHVSAAAAAAFSMQLVGAASEVGGELDNGFDVSEQGPDLEEREHEVEREPVRKGPRAARDPRRKVEGLGGIDEGGGAEPEPDAPGESRPDRSARWPRVSPARRSLLLDLDLLLRVGEETGVLVGWQARTLTPLVFALGTEAFHRLLEVVHPLPTPFHRVLLLQSLAAHRHAADLVRGSEALTAQDEASLRDWHAERRGARSPADRERPRDEASLATLVEHYDPLHRWLCEPEVEESVPNEPWNVPQWLRGAPREPLELAALAFHQAAAGSLSPDPTSRDGASDPLTAALERHGASHPAIGRWCVTLAARADHRDGLLSACEALLRARRAL